MNIQPFFRFQVSFHVLFDKDGYIADEVKEFHFEYINEAFHYFKKKQVFALEDLNGINTESECNALVESFELIGSVWIYNRIVNLIFDLYKIIMNGTSSYVELPVKDLSNSHIQNKNGRHVEPGAYKASLQTVKVNAC